MALKCNILVHIYAWKTKKNYDFFHRVFSKIPGWECAPLFTFIWSECCSVADKVALCAKVDAGIGRQIWEIFIHLDVDSQGKVHVDDLCDLTLRILRENGHVELEQNIKEWFCEEILIDFWSFFAAVVENYSGLLKVRQVYYIMCEVHVHVRACICGYVHVMYM